MIPENNDLAKKITLNWIGIGTMVIIYKIF